MFTILPQRCSRIPGSTSWHIRTRPKTLVSNWRRTSSSGNGLDGAALAVAGVVHEHADRALGLLDASTAVRIEASSVTSSASVTQPSSARSSIDSTRRAVA